MDGSLTRLESFVRGEHVRYRRLAGCAAGPGELMLPARAGLAVEAPATPLLEQLLADFTRFCGECMGVSLVRTSDAPVVRLRLTGAPGAARDVFDPAAERFAVSVSPDGVEIEAADERGLLHATHHVERLMADRGGPVLPLGRREAAPAFAPRITTVCGFDWSDEYLSLLSHFGVNGMLIGAETSKYVRSRLFPEFNGPDAEKNLAELNRKVDLLLRHGFDTYILVNSRPLAADHPVFLRDPSRRGAPYRVFDETACQYVLCSGNEDVLAFYDETVENLFRDVPAAAGAAFLVGGEGFMHCYSRPLGPFEGHSSCPRCRDVEPSEAVAALFSRLAARIKRTGPRKPVLAWPYSAFTWSGAEDRAQLAWMRRLSGDVTVLSNFDTNSPDEKNGAGVYLYDYNIKSVGPSAVFRAQAETAAAMGRPICAKTECNISTSAYFAPYVPVHVRWHQRFREMRAAGAAGYMNQWFFRGMAGTLPDEMQYHAVWNPDADAADILARAAVRDFGLDARAAARAVAAWRAMSAAWDDFPYSATTNGEREFYGRGPFHYGPAHPLVFNVQNRYGLPARFFGLSGDLYSLASPAEREALLANAKPRYVSELLLTLPYGTERYLELAGRCRAGWAAGVAALREALGPEPSERARMELDICETFEIHLTTLENTVRFLATRDRLWRTPADVGTFATGIGELSAILRAEIANAERSLPILEREFRIRPYDAEMVRAKIGQCRYVLEQELPIFSTMVRFHVWNDYP